MQADSSITLNNISKTVSIKYHPATISEKWRKLLDRGRTLVYEKNSVSTGRRGGAN
jgi:hypothetical protein